MVGPFTNRLLEREGDIRRLREARLDLQGVQFRLAYYRWYFGSMEARGVTTSYGIKASDWPGIEKAITKKLYSALDRVWALQCMVKGAFG